MKKTDIELNMLRLYQKLTEAFDRPEVLKSQLALRVIFEIYDRVSIRIMSHNHIYILIYADETGIPYFQYFVKTKTGNICKSIIESVCSLYQEEGVIKIR